jgi:hypothetical protein
LAEGSQAQKSAQNLSHWPTMMIFPAAGRSTVVIPFPQFPPKTVHFQKYLFYAIKLIALPNPVSVFSVRHFSFGRRKGEGQRRSKLNDQS